MFNSLEVLVEPLIRTRLESLYTDLVKTKPDYIQFSTECGQYFKQIRDAIPDDLQHTIFLYEDAQVSLQAILESRIYLQGFKDAIYLFNEALNK